MSAKLNVSQSEAIRMAVLHREQKVSPDEDISVGVNRVPQDHGHIEVRITRSRKSADECEV